MDSRLKTNNFDAHFHIIDPAFPLVANQGYLPESYLVEDYLRVTKPLGITGGALVSGSFQAYDQTYLLSALSRLGPAYVGVTQLPTSTSDDEIIKLNQKGIRAIRFNIKRGNKDDIDQFITFSQRVHSIARWHTEIYADPNQLMSLKDRLLRLPSIVIDHLGLLQASEDVLLELVTQGAKVKATGFGRIDFKPEKLIEKIHSINPESLMFGTDLPSTRAKRPFDEKDMDLILEVLGESSVEAVFRQNALSLYKPALINPPAAEA